MFLKKNIIFVCFLITSTLLISGCEWSSNCTKKTCKSCPTKEVVILEEDEKNKKNKEIDETLFEENDK
jgi:hypothetical protein